MSSSGNSSPETDKEQLYGEYMARTRWIDKLYRKGCHKALDIPDDGLNFTQGISGKHLVVLGALILAGLLGWRGIDRLSTPMAEPPAAAPSAAPSPIVPMESQSFRVRFHAEDGTEIEVEPEQQGD